MHQTTRRKIPVRPADDPYNNPPWTPADASVTKRRWRLKVYAMENNLKALLERVRRDFAGALRHVPAGYKPE